MPSASAGMIFRTGLCSSKAEQIVDSKTVQFKCIGPFGAIDRTPVDVMADVPLGHTLYCFSGTRV